MYSSFDVPVPGLNNMSTTYESNGIRKLFIAPFSLHDQQSIMSWSI